MANQSGSTLQSSERIPEVADAMVDVAADEAVVPAARQEEAIEEATEVAEDILPVGDHGTFIPHFVTQILIKSYYRDGGRDGGYGGGYGGGRDRDEGRDNRGAGIFESQ